VEIDPTIRDWLLDRRPPLRSPVGDTFVVVGCQSTLRRDLGPPYRSASEFHGVRSFVVPTVFRDQVLSGRLKYGTFHDDAGFEENGVFELGDFRDEDGVRLERIVRLRVASHAQ